jgi:hypothetical protein
LGNLRGILHGNWEDISDLRIQEKRNSHSVDRNQKKKEHPERHS